MFNFCVVEHHFRPASGMMVKAAGSYLPDCDSSPGPGNLKSRLCLEEKELLHDSSLWGTFSLFLGPVSLECAFLMAKLKAKKSS